MCGSTGKMEFPEDMGLDKIGGQAVEKKRLPTKRSGPMPIIKRRLPDIAGYPQLKAPCLHYGFSVA